MAQLLESLIAEQVGKVAALKKRIAGIDAMISQGQNERNELVADTLEASGRLEGLKAALALQSAKEDKPAEEPS